MKTLAKMFQDDKGNPSSTRVVWFIGTIVIIFVWSYLCISTGAIVHLTVGDATAFGMILGLKPGSKFVENRN